MCIARNGFLRDGDRNPLVDVKRNAMRRELTLESLLEPRSKDANACWS